jgi:hypothetical protein
MTEETNRPNDEKEDDLADWLRQLRNAQHQEDSPATVENKAMYQAIVENHRADIAELLEDAQTDDHAWQQMRFRLKRENLLQPKRWKTWLPLAMAASILAVVMLPTLKGAGVEVLDSEPTALRGGAMAFQVADPLKQAKSVAKELKSLDPSLKLHWFGGVATIDVDLEAAELDPAEAILRQLVPTRAVRLAIGFNRLEFSGLK